MAITSNIVATLRERGLLKDVTDEGIEEYLCKNVGTVYIGFDPTADGLHVGHMVSMMVLRHFQLAGHRPIALVGGGTGMIGDPSGRSEERNLLTREQLDRNVAGLRADLARIIDFTGPNAAVLLNNADWLADFRFLDFLRDVGRHFRISDMLAKDSVRRRLESDAGLSYTEFSYMLLQAYDFKYLNEHHGCTVQGGGSDQWGNITAGTELIRRTSGRPCFGITTPLLTNSQGQKMGKSLSGAVWINPAKLSPYEFYQFWVRQEDADVARFLRMLTFLPLDEVATIVAAHEADPAQRIGQKRLALEITTMVHGREEAERARAASEALFGGKLERTSDEDLRRIFPDVPSVDIPRAELEAGIRAADLVVRAGLAPSKKEAGRLLEQGGLYLNNSEEPLAKDFRQFTTEHLAGESMMVLRAGKKKYALVQAR
jgi:tyrosyl-tRNA synthetase